MDSSKMAGESASERVAAAARNLLDDDPEAAIAALAQVAQLGGNDMPLRFVTALVSWYLGDLANTRALTQACHDQAPMNGTVAEVLASLYAQSGDLVESLY